MTVRQQQVESVLQRNISQVLQRKLADPRVRGLVSVTRVEVSADLHKAGVYVSVLPARYESVTIAGLRSAAGRIHKLVRKSMTSRTVPHLDFRLDQSLKHQAAIHEAIQQGIDREEPTT